MFCCVETEVEGRTRFALLAELSKTKHGGPAYLAQGPVRTCISSRIENTGRRRGEAEYIR
jgi:hypothetical protein